jgi:hypothetical protein
MSDLHYAVQCSQQCDEDGGCTECSTVPACDAWIDEHGTRCNLEASHTARMSPVVWVDPDNDRPMCDEHTAEYRERFAAHISASFGGSIEVSPIRATESRYETARLSCDALCRPIWHYVPAGNVKRQAACGIRTSGDGYYADELRAGDCLRMCDGCFAWLESR